MIGLRYLIENFPLLSSARFLSICLNKLTGVYVLCVLRWTNTFTCSKRICKFYQRFMKLPFYRLWSTMGSIITFNCLSTIQARLELKLMSISRCVPFSFWRSSTFRREQQLRRRYDWHPLAWYVYWFNVNRVPLVRQGEAYMRSGGEIPNFYSNCFIVNSVTNFTTRMTNSVICGSD